MQNRNLTQSASKRPTSNTQSNSSNYHLSLQQNYQFLQENFTQPNSDTLQSPIMKMKFQLSPTMSRIDTLKYSVNTYNQPNQAKNSHRSNAQSPQKQNKIDPKFNFLAAKKYSVPDTKMLTQVLHKEKRFSTKKNQGNNEFMKPLRKLPGKKIDLRTNNEEDFERNYQHEPITFYSQQLIESPSEEHSEKYSNLVSNFQELQRELEQMKQENMRLKRSKEELMNENIQIKRESSSNLNALSNQIEDLKEQIYRMEMERQQIPNGQRGNNMGLGFSQQSGMLSVRGSFSQHMENGNINMFYVEELEKQNDQLVRENRRLNEIVMKRLKHSIAQ